MIVSVLFIIVSMHAHRLLIPSSNFVSFLTWFVYLAEIQLSRKLAIYVQLDGNRIKASQETRSRLRRAHLIGEQLLVRALRSLAREWLIMSIYQNAANDWSSLKTEEATNHFSSWTDNERRSIFIAYQNILINCVSKHELKNDQRDKDKSLTAVPTGSYRPHFLL